jgi:hypothetical protein
MTTAQYQSLALTQERLIQHTASIEAKVEHMGQDINILCKLVRDGNGQPSIMQRLAQAEIVLEGQVKDLEQISQYANSMNASRMLTRTQLVVGLSGMILTVLLSSFSVYAAIMK